MTESWFRKAAMFMDGEGGAATQVHDLYVGPSREDARKSGIQLIWSRQTGTDPGSRYFVYDDRHFTDFKDAVAAWRAAEESR